MHAAGMEVSTVLHEGFGMSMDLMVQAMKIKVGNPLRKLVLLKLADNASDLGSAGLVTSTSLTSVKLANVR